MKPGLLLRRGSICRAKLFQLRDTPQLWRPGTLTRPTVQRPGSHDLPLIGPRRAEHPPAPGLSVRQTDGAETEKTVDVVDIKA